MLAAADPDLGIFVYVPLIFALVGAAIPDRRVPDAPLPAPLRRRRAEGRVTDLRVRRQYEGPGQVGNPMYFPVLAFLLPGGHAVQTEARIGTSPAPAQVGDEVTVLYDPTDPERTQLEGSGRTRSMSSSTPRERSYQRPYISISSAIVNSSWRPPDCRTTPMRSCSARSPRAGS